MPEWGDAKNTSLQSFRFIVNVLSIDVLELLVQLFEKLSIRSTLGIKIVVGLGGHLAMRTLCGPRYTPCVCTGHLIDFS